MAPRFPLVRDAFERVVFTFVAAVLGLATADGVDLTQATSLGSWKAWGAAGLIAAFTLLKTIIAARIGSGTSASVDPAVQLRPTTD